MKTSKPIFIALLLCIISSLCLAQSAEHKTYDYISIIAFADNRDYVYISINGEKFEIVKPPDIKNWENMNGVINIVKKYEKEGYELFANNYSKPSIYFLLRKEHKE